MVANMLKLKVNSLWFRGGSLSKMYMNNWYVIRTKTKKEKDVLNQLTKAQYEIFFPQMKGLVSLRPLFPNYLFIRTNFEDSCKHQMVRYTRGVNKILGDGKGPKPISSIVVETLKKLTLNGSLIEQNLLFKEGDEIIVKKGILKDLRGIIKKNLSSSGRVEVLFKWFNHDNWFNCKMKALLKYQDLEKIA